MSDDRNNRILFGDLARAVVAPVLAELGASDRKRFEQILGLVVHAKTRLTDCLQALFPTQDQADAMKVFANLRSRFNKTFCLRIQLISHLHHTNHTQYH